MLKLRKTTKPPPSAKPKQTIHVDRLVLFDSDGNELVTWAVNRTLCPGDTLALENLYVTTTK